MAENNKIRPYWHVDLKWIFGILTTLFLSVSLLLFSLSILTSEKTAIPLVTFIVASQFSKNGLDDPKDIEETKAKFLNSRQDVFYPIEGQNVSITRSDLETLSPRELRLKIFRQVVEPYYFGQVDEETKKKAGLLAIVSHTTHNIINQIFFISIIPLLLSLFGLLFFSYRYGKLISPAVIFLLVSTFPSLLLFLIQNTTPPSGDTGPFSALPREFVLHITAALSPVFFIIFFAGIGLMALALGIKLVNKLRDKKGT